jgi:hypothetical protein
VLNVYDGSPCDCQADGVTFVLGRLHPDEIIEYMTGMHDYIRIKHEKKVRHMC